ncbi:hypothetical protein FGSG_07702 [Fusarium graminearum PH-1]|uniref:Chromosome 4, complete genome n=1 Tax=Gibberella zeae (strain ATCC MYA-4620 / CBS 123657 / FGSC 9075 / NRRL 31084 / PH-1) TaxID=229533 RepID=I1RU26_GIBZE|nr:hypothetical protein FGSG_07702 [Fusarium graminearum PH-1]ESU13994.1 hypothetical protein FGSG_07702 [Fusarium graminearum PH-1]CEF83305.1 unnamed protein product [Fusarium graminearum]|eukprot:XP_011327501.1 hypothetical protein FGSG_07702 [Fusarium graminearum PH-1]
MNMPLLNQDDVDALRQKVDAFTQGPNGIPGLVCVVVDSKGEHIFDHVSGTRGSGISKPMTFDTTFWMASCTKLVTTIAALQLVEQGNVALDSEEDIQRILPELSDVMVLSEDESGDLKLVPRERNITLRMLLTHTAGFGYSFSNPKIKKWYDPAGIDEFDDQELDVYSQPLVNQPGTIWEYGVNTDWVGRLIERVSNVSLGTYFQSNILGPLQVSRTTFLPTPEMKDGLAYMHTRGVESGTIKISDEGHPMRRPLRQLAGGTKTAFGQSGGAGLFSNPAQYSKIIAMLLNKGKDAQSSCRILQEKTVEEMFSNQIPQFPDYARYQDSPWNPPQGWGLGSFLLLEPGSTGRAAGSGWWSGLSNLIWWADPTNGIGGILATQILPYGGVDTDVFDCQRLIEGETYRSVFKKRSRQN